eukprot:COSAG02_NODE_7609_length_2935_cov_18.687212_2_plen_110_part_00
MVNRGALYYAGEEIAPETRVEQSSRRTHRPLSTAHPFPPQQSPVCPKHTKTPSFSTAPDHTTLAHNPEKSEMARESRIMMLCNTIGIPGRIRQSTVKMRDHGMPREAAF